MSENFCAQWSNSIYSEDEAIVKAFASLNTTSGGAG